MPRLNRPLVLLVLLLPALGALPPHLHAAPATPGELLELVMDLAASRALAWTTMGIELDPGDRARLTVTAAARLHQFAPIMALAAGPAEVDRVQGLRTLTMDVGLDSPSAPATADRAFSTVLSTLVGIEGGGGTLSLAPGADETTIVIQATVPASTPARLLRTLLPDGSAGTMTLERLPDGPLRLNGQATLAPWSTDPADLTGLAPPDWTLSPTEGGTSETLRPSRVSRADVATLANRILRGCGDRLRLMSATVRPDGAALSASLAPSSGTVQGP